MQSSDACLGAKGRSEKRLFTDDPSLCPPAPLSPLFAPPLPYLNRNHPQRLPYAFLQLFCRRSAPHPTNIAIRPNQRRAAAANGSLFPECFPGSTGVSTVLLSCRARKQDHDPQVMDI